MMRCLLSSALAILVSACSLTRDLTVDIAVAQPPRYIQQITATDGRGGWAIPCADYATSTVCNDVASEICADFEVIEMEDGRQRPEDRYLNIVCPKPEPRLH